jgi:hypothetical protein
MVSPLVRGCHVAPCVSLVFPAGTNKVLSQLRCMALANCQQHCAYAPTSTKAHLMYKLISALLLCCASPAFSQPAPQIDLELTLEANPPFPWVIGQEGVFITRVKNLSTTLTANNVLVQPQSAIPPNVPPNDVFDPTGAPNSCAISFFCSPCSCYEVAAIAPGETRACEFPFRAVASYNNPGRSRWNTFMIFTSDPNLDNNTAQILAGVVTARTEVPLAPSTPALLAALIALSGGWVLSTKRWR